MALAWESLFASLFQLTLPAGKTGFANAEFAFKLSGVLAAAFQQLDCLSLELICVRSSALCHLSPSDNDYTRSLSLCPLFRGKIIKRSEVKSLAFGRALAEVTTTDEIPEVCQDVIKDAAERARRKMGVVNG